MSFWQNRAVAVTGGGGFLSSYMVNRLKQAECRQVVVPRRREDDLCYLDVGQRLLNGGHPGLIIHAAGIIRWIGANRAHPAEFNTTI